MKVFKIENSLGMNCSFISSGASLVSLVVPLKKGSVDVVLGLRSLEDYSSVETNSSYIGCIVGRNSNRIREGRFELNGKKYKLSKNSGEHHLHGTFCFVEWKMVKWEKNKVSFSYESKNGEEGYPCDLNVVVTYSLSEEINELVVEYESLNKDHSLSTICNLTNHSYFNLNGVEKDNIKDVSNHFLRMNSSKITELDDFSIPTGELKDVMDSKYDFTKFSQVGLKDYDINFCLKNEGGIDDVVASLRCPENGLCMDVRTTSLGCQLYNGVFLKDVKGKDGVEYEKYDGICLETQYFPNSMNIPSFTSPVIGPNETQKHRTSFAFSLLGVLVE